MVHICLQQQKAPINYTAKLIIYFNYAIFIAYNIICNILLHLQFIIVLYLVIEKEGIKYERPTSLEICGTACK